jgi:o-succinylbenzoate synthase
MSYLPSEIIAFLSTPVSLAKLELVVIDLPQINPFRSGIGVRNSRKALIIKWHTNEGVIGYGECSCRPDPFYSHEFVDGAIQVVKEYIFPLLKNATTYYKALAALSKIRGWNFTKAAVEFAMNDAIRRSTGKGILEVWDRPRLKKVPVGISLGLFEDGISMEKDIAEAEEAGYTRLKFKINPSYASPSILNALRKSQHSNLSFDANGSFTMHDFDSLQQFAELGHMIEQPFAPGSSYLIKEFEKNNTSLTVCFDEEIETLGQLIDQNKKQSELNIKPGRVGGLYNTIEMMEYCITHNIPAWIGGMFETGIGRAQNLQIASFLSKAKAHDLSPSSRYFTKDVLRKPIEMDDGYISKDYFMDSEIDESIFDELTVSKMMLSNFY